MAAADVLILGGCGTLGHVLASTLAPDLTLLVASREAKSSAVTDTYGFDVLQPDADLRALLQRLGAGALVINAVGVLASELGGDISMAQRERATAINSEFPHRLARAAGDLGLRVIHISTDAVFDHNAGLVTETDATAPADLYGASKAAGELSDPHCLTIRCSFVGPPAPGRDRGLWAWLMRQPAGATLRGHVNHLWAGLTSYQLASACMAMADAAQFAQVRAHGPLHHLASNPVISKFKLLQVMSQVLRPDLIVEPVPAQNPVSRILVSRYGALDRATPRHPNWTAAIAAAAQFHRG